MTAQSTQARIPAAADAAANGAAEPKHGAEIFVPLNLLKASPKNARKVKHSEAILEGLAASIKAKGVLQPPVVEIERAEDGAPTGAYLVTIGEGRRLALRMLVKRKAIKRNHPVKVTVDTENDAHEISLDENVTREAMHPSRLDRDFGRQRFGDVGYAREELVAELGAAFLCADLGLALEPREDHAAYIASWLQVLKDDKRFIVSAASHAQKAVDHLHGLQPPL